MKKLLVKIGVVLAVALLCSAFVIASLTVGYTDDISLGRVRLNIETYLAGKNQPTHPSFYDFGNKWNGYRYWMSYSPYPYGNGQEENPCIAVSNDLLYWETPKNLANPIADNEETGCDELKDPHIVYREDLKRMEVWYLGRLSENLGGDGESLTLFRKYSNDGISWSDFEVMSVTKYLSPTVIWKENKYCMWSIGFDIYDTQGTIVYQESKDGFSWSEPIKCSINSNKEDIDIWHGSVTEHDGIYYMSFVDASDKQEIFCCKSNNGIDFSKAEIIVKNDKTWEKLYRPFLTFDGKEYICIYGVINDANEWYLSLSKGEKLDELKGLTTNEISSMYPLKDEPINTRGLKYIYDKIYDGFMRCFRAEVLLLAVAEVLFMWIFEKLRNEKYTMMCAILNFVITYAFVGLLNGFLSVYTIVAAIVLSGIMFLILQTSKRALLKEKT